MYVLTLNDATIKMESLMHLNDLKKHNDIMLKY